MKSIPCLIADFAGRGIFLKDNDGAIGYRAPAGVLTADDKDLLRARKREFLTYLRARNFPEPGPRDDGHAPSLASFYQEVWWRWFKDVPVLLPYERVELVKHFAATDAADVAAALTRVVGRHDALRMFFRQSGGKLIAGVHDAADFRVEIRALADAGDLSAATQDFFAASPRVFDEWLIKARVFALPGGAAALVVAFNHTICDGGSHQILSAELEAEIANPNCLPPDSALSYRAFAAAERQWFSGEARAALADYWSQWIARIPVLRSPQGKTPLVWGPGARVSAQASLDAGAAQRLAGASQALQTSPAMLLLAALALALKNWSGQSNFALRAVADGRTHAALGATVGLILRHYLVEADIPADADAAALIHALECEYESGAVLRFPTHWDASGADFQSLHQKIAVTFNYLALPYDRATALMGASPNAEESVIRWHPAVIDWPAALPPVQLRVMHFTDGIEFVFEFNQAVLARDEQDALIRALLAGVATLSTTG